MNLTPNFTLEEMTASQTATRKGIDNSPHDLTTKGNLRAICLLLEVIRSDLNKPIRISSGYRCLELNRAVGSRDSSAHTKGLAVDISVTGMTTKELAEQIADMNLPFDQIILEYPDSKTGGWVHLGMAEKGLARRQLLTINSTGTHLGLIA